MATKKTRKADAEWAESTTTTQTENSRRKANKIAFNSWFAKKQKSKSVKKWQADEILTFFRKQGLTDKEEAAAFDKAFTRF